MADLITENRPFIPRRDLADNRARQFSLSPESEARKAIAEELSLLGLRKVTLSGTITPQGKSDWLIEAKLGATVVQACVVTLSPVTTRIDDHFSRSFTNRKIEIDPEEDFEIPQEDMPDPLGEGIDLEALLLETLSLALPPYPRADGAELGDAAFTEPGKDALSDADVRPFAELAALRDKLAGKE